MRVATDLSLKNRITRMLWVVNAISGSFFALLGGVMVVNLFGYDPQLAPLMARAGTSFVVIGAMLGLYSFWKARSITGMR